MQLRIAVGVDVPLLPLLGVGQLDAVQRGYGSEDTAGVDHRAHVAVEQRQQQAANVRAVHVGVGHQDDLAVPRRDEVEAAPGPRTDDLQDGGALRIAKHVGVG